MTGSQASSRRSISDMMSPSAPNIRFEPKFDDGHLPTTSGLPYGWTGPELDEKSGRTYYRNHKSGRVQGRPPPLASTESNLSPPIKKASLKTEPNPKPNPKSLPHSDDFKQTSRSRYKSPPYTIKKTKRKAPPPPPPRNRSPKSADSSGVKTLDPVGDEKDIDLPPAPSAPVTEAEGNLSSKPKTPRNPPSTMSSTASLESVPLPSPPPVPVDLVTVPEFTSPKRVYTCLASPGLGFRKEHDWESKVKGDGIKEGDKIEGEERLPNWIFVDSKNMWLPLAHEGKHFLQPDPGIEESRANLLMDIKTKGRSNIGARAKLLTEITKGKMLKKVNVFRDVGSISVEASVMQDAVMSNIVSYDTAVQLWKFFISKCPKDESKNTAVSAAEKIGEIKRMFSSKELSELVLQLKKTVKPKTMTYVKKKYLNCISGAEIMFFFSTNEQTKDLKDITSLGTLILDIGMLRNASAKKVNNVKGLPIKADHYYRYGDIVLMEGYLDRNYKNMFKKAYKKRYYKLVECGIGSRSKRQEYRLESYLKKGEKDFHSFIDITDARLDPIPRLALDFLIKSSRELRLKANSQNEKKLWVDLLKSILGASQVEQKNVSAFGSRLSKVLKSTQNSFVPKVVWECVEYIRKCGMTTEGVFRKPGLHERIVELKKAFDHDIPVTFQPNDVHPAAGCLKQWLRELPEPLVPFQYYTLFLDNASSSAEELRKIVRKLPQHNQELLGYLCEFLKELSENHEITRMHTQNIALVFAPNILRPEIDDPMEALQHAQKKINALGNVIDNVYEIFGLKKKDEVVDFL
ncbi:hypothetical protein AAMO2058_000377100 [Amorphochlora amoebiformis]